MSGLGDWVIRELRRHPGADPGFITIFHIHYSARTSMAGIGMETPNEYLAWKHPNDLTIKSCRHCGEEPLQEIVDAWLLVK